MDTYKSFLQNTPNTLSVFKPYHVKIASSALNVRTEPSITSKVVETLINDAKIYKIVDEDNGWGKLESVAGWILLKYTVKI